MVSSLALLGVKYKCNVISQQLPFSFAANLSYILCNSNAFIRLLLHGGRSVCSTILLHYASVAYVMSSGHRSASKSRYFCFIFLFIILFLLSEALSHT